MYSLRHCSINRRATEERKHKARIEAVKIILNSIDYTNRNYSIDFESDDKFNISVSKELARMRKKKDY